MLCTVYNLFVHVVITQQCRIKQRFYRKQTLLSYYHYYSEIVSRMNFTLVSQNFGIIDTVISVDKKKVNQRNQ